MFADLKINKAKDIRQWPHLSFIPKAKVEDSMMKVYGIMVS